MAETQGSITDTIQRAAGAAATAFGVAAIAAPGLLTSVYGMKERGGNFAFMSRMWGTRTAALGGLTLTAQPGSERRRLMLVAALLNVADATIAVRGQGTSARTKVMVAMTSGAFAAATAVALAGDQRS